jgi:hypothetical protein
MCRWWILNHSAHNRLTEHPWTHRVSKALKQAVLSSRPHPSQQEKLACELVSEPLSTSWQSVAVRPKTNVRKALRLACWKYQGVSDTKLGVEVFLHGLGVYTCLLNETLHTSSRPLWLANYVFHRPDRPTVGAGTGILVRSGITYCAHPVSCL